VPAIKLDNENIGGHCTPLHAGTAVPGMGLISYSVRLKLDLSEFTFMLNCIEKFYF